MKKTIAALALGLATLSAPAFAQDAVPDALSDTTLTPEQAAGVAAAMVGLLIIIDDDDDSTTTTTTTTTTGTP